MEKVALISGSTFVYWSSIVLALAVAAGICAYLSLYLKSGRSGFAAALSVPMGLALSAVCGRFLHWYCRTDSYPGMKEALTDYSWGSYALIGVFVGCAVTVLVLAVLRLASDWPHMLDSAAVGIGVGISLGRLASFFNASDKGLLVPASWFLPLAYPVTNPVSGVSEMRLATFLLQALFTAAIVICLLLVRKKLKKPGDLCLLFLTYYCAGQVFFDSTRYDSLFLRANGFVSIVQIMAAVGLVLAMLAFTLPLMLKKQGKTAGILWGSFLAFTGGAGFMEYYVQRHGDQAAFAYAVMILCLTVMCVIATIAYKKGSRAITPQKGGKFARK